MSTDSPNHAALASLIAMRDEAVAAHAKAKKDVEKAKERVKSTEITMDTLNAAITRIGGGSETPKSQKDAILAVINANGEQGMTTQQILEKLAESGLTMSAANPQASIHVAADRLSEAGLIEIVHSTSGKLFKRKAA